MIFVDLELEREASVLSCRAEGHALFDVAGKDIVCAAVTMLLRTVCEALQKSDGIEVTCEARVRGTLDFTAEGCTTEGATRIEFAALLLQTGVQDLQTEYPGHVSLRTKISMEE
jgi:uncharacterized protein YsxB (DUF464 family)